MKLKELPVSLWHTLKLKLISPSKIIYANGKEYPVVVSLTTIAYRLPKVHLVIKNILSQDLRPQHIVLWLNEGLSNQIPNSLKMLEGDIFKIKFTTLHCPHKKLIHSLELYKNLPIATCDDDVIYDRNWLFSLVKTHQNHPNEIIAHKVRCIKLKNDGSLLPYKYWNCSEEENSKYWLPIGEGGVLYPAGCFSDLVMNEKLFLKLAPKADDLWFKAVALAENIACRKVEIPVKKPIPIIGTQKISLKKENVGEDKNVVQWKNLEAHFNFKLTE
ncbi:MAG: hypothetical protein ACK5NB_03665 [Flavobacteriaceae bacterium]